MNNKPLLRLVVNNKERINMSELRTPIGKLCLKLTRTSRPVKEDAKLKSAISSLFASFYKEKKEAEAFGVVKSPLSSFCASLYSSLVAFVPRGKTPEKEAEESLLKSGWSVEKVQTVRLLEAQLKSA